MTMLTYPVEYINTIFKRFILHNTLVALGVLFGTQTVAGQGNIYWSWNFNTPSNLLAGAVVGGGAGQVYFNG